jgi:type II secretory pathway component GspD/PulD (secretin)
MISRRLGLFLLVLTLVACNNEKNRTLIDQRSEQAQKGMIEAQHPAPPLSYDPLSVTDKVWVGSAATRLRRGVPLPARFDGPHGIALVSAEPMSLTEIASSITTQTGIPVRIAPGSITGGTTSGGQNNGASAGNQGMPISFEGPLSNLLDQAAGYFGINWRYDGASINFSRFETRVFMVESLPGTQSVKDGMKEDQDSGSSSSTSNSSSTTSGGGSYSASSTNSLEQSSTMNVELKVWDELEKTITSMLNGTGSVVIAPSSGTVTVTTTSDNMRTVAKFIEEENKRLSHQIAINVEIYSVELDQQSDFSFTFQEALRRLTNVGGNYLSPSGSTATGTISNFVTSSGQSTGVETGLTGGAIAGGGSLAVAILNPKTTGQISGLFSALSSIADTTRVAQFPMTTLNNRPVSRRIGTDQTYVASISNSTSTNFSNNSVTPGTIREGFSIQLTPRVLDDGRIMMQYSLSLIDIINLTNFSVGTGQSIQLPETSSRVFVQQAMLKSGSTLILGGYGDEQATQGSQGVGDAFNYFLGGGSTNAKKRTMLFIAITPQCLDVPRSEPDQQ